MSEAFKKAAQQCFDDGITDSVFWTRDQVSLPDGTSIWTVSGKCRDKRGQVHEVDYHAATREEATKGLLAALEGIRG